MTLRRLHRIVAPVTIASLVVLAWATCTDDGVSMAEMACCVEHQQHCAMHSEAAERCCSPDYQARIDVIKPQRSPDTLTGAATTRLATAVETIAIRMSEPGRPALSPAEALVSRLAGHPHTTVLRI